MASSRLSEETVGKMFVDKHGQYWQHVAYCADPSATIVAAETPPFSLAPPKRSGAVGSPILNELDLRLLVPEDTQATATAGATKKDRSAGESG